MAVSGALAHPDYLAYFNEFAASDPDIEGDQLRVTASTSNDVGVVEVLRALDAERVGVADIERRHATLDDVFLTLTGRSSTDASTDDTTDQEVAA